jgi:hypothetical protein
MGRVAEAFAEICKERPPGPVSRPMTRVTLSVLVVLLSFGCTRSAPPPEMPIVPVAPVAPDIEPSESPPVATSGTERGAALRVFAAEQRALVQTLSARASRSRTATTNEAEIDRADRNATLEGFVREERLRELKEQLRTLATRLSLLDDALRP